MDSESTNRKNSPGTVKIKIKIKVKVKKTRKNKENDLKISDHNI